MSSAVIFDLDGILVDSENYKYMSWKEAFKRVGIDMSREEFFEDWVIRGCTFSETLRKHGFGGEIKEEDLRPIVSKHYLGYIESEISLMTGAIEVLDRLEGEFPLGLASSSHKLYVDKIVEKLGIADRFVAFASGSEVERLKPNPDLLLLVAGRIGVSPEECVAVDDAPKGVLAAKRAGMSVIAVPTEDTRLASFEDAEIVLPCLSEITADLVRLL